MARAVLHAAGTAGALASAWALDDLRAHDAFGDFEPAAPVPDAAALARAEQERATRAAADEEAAEAARQQDALDALLDDAFQRGAEEGRVAGEIAERARLRTAVAAAEQALDDLRQGEARWTGMVEENICALAAAIARQIIGRELREDPQTIVALASKALEEFPVDQPIAVRVCASDLATISASTADGLAPARLEGHELRWVADPRIAPGGCLVEGRDRIVDGRVDTALERVYRRLTYTQA